MADVQRFSIEQFVIALPKKKHQVTGELVPMFEYIGIDNNEHCWAMPLGVGKLRILVRSSINAATGIADGTGDNSIRMIVQRRSLDKWFNIGKGPDAFTQRVPGWEGRLRIKLKEVYGVWAKVKQDFTDDEKVFMSRTEATKGRVFAKHPSTGDFRWLS